MKKLLKLICLLLSFGCMRTEYSSSEKWRTIEVGDYLFDFPSDFVLIEEKGIDSYVGKVKGDSISFDFDFGYYSHSFEKNTQEYLNEGDWRLVLQDQFMQEGIVYDETNRPKVDILNIRPATVQDSVIGKSCDYVASCKYRNFIFNYPIYLPNQIKQLNFIVDTIDGQYRKIVVAKDSRKGVTGVYIRGIDDFDNSMNSYLALSLATGGLTVQQQEIAVKIFKTGRHKK